MRFLIMVNLGQRSTILEKKWKITKNCQKSWLFRKICLLWHPNSPQFWRSIYEPALSPLIAINWKNTRNLIFWHFFRKSQLGMFSIRGKHDFRTFSMLKWKFLNCDFWPRKCSKGPNLVPGAVKNVLASNKNLQFFRFLDLEKFPKFFFFLVKFSKNLIIFLEKSCIFFKLFWTGIELLLIGLSTGIYSTCLSWLDEKTKRNKIPHFFRFF